jgi:hypothetical protein
VPQTSHTEAHFTGGALFTRHRYWHGRRTNRSFALADGLSAAVSSTHVVIIAGLAPVPLLWALAGFLPPAVMPSATSRNSCGRKEKSKLFQMRKPRRSRTYFSPMGLPNRNVVTRELRLSGAPCKPYSSALWQLVLPTSSSGGFPWLASRRTHLATGPSPKGSRRRFLTIPIVLIVW